jgi:hypothetical protein
MDNDERVGIGREIVAGVIGITILIITLVMMYETYHSAAQAFPADNEKSLFDAYTRQKELLQLALGLLGTVTGYYLGRIPAERAASRANQEATEAKQKRNNVAKSAQNLADKAQALLDRDQQQPRSTLSEAEPSGPDGHHQNELRAAIHDVQTELMK